LEAAMSSAASRCLKLMIWIVAEKVVGLDAYLYGEVRVIFFCLKFITSFEWLDSHSKICRKGLFALENTPQFPYTQNPMFIYLKLISICLLQYYNPKNRHACTVSSDGKKLLREGACYDTHWLDRKWV
jgi:hypothetical protein